MNRIEAIFWVAQLQLAKEGNEEVKEALEIENQSRREKGMPTVQEELAAMVKE